MKQVLQNLRSGEVEVLDVPVPSLRAGFALIKTAASLVSAGTERSLVEFAQKSLLSKAQSRPDLVRQLLVKAQSDGLVSAVGAAFSRLEHSFPLGYSSSGTIIEVGGGMEGFRAGQRVACAGGGHAVHAEYSLVPKNLIASLPQKVSFEAGAFATLGAIAMHAFRLADVQLGSRIAVIGAGVLGLLAAGIAKAAGCDVVAIDLDENRLAIAKEMGVRAILREGAEAASDSLSKGRGFDAVLICADSPSSDPVNLAGEIAGERAKVIAVGAVDLSIPRNLYYRKELSFIVSRSYGPGRYDPEYEERGRDYPAGYVRWTEGRNLEAFVELVSSGKLDITPLISHRFPIEEAAEAYELIIGKKKEPFLGVLFTYPHAEKLDKVDDKQTVVLVPGDKKEHAGVKVGVLGAGNFAANVMLPAMRRVKHLGLEGIASGSGLTASQVGRRFGFRYATSDEEEVIKDPQSNAIAILTRHHHHARQVVSALKAGKHTFCEKPLALKESELDEISAALKKKKSPLLMVGFNRRFSPLGVALKEFFAACDEPMMVYYRVNAGSIPLDHWVHDPEQGGGRILGEVCHFVDFLTFLVGELPSSVRASGRGASPTGR